MAVYKVPRSAFLKLWHKHHVEGGSIHDLVQEVSASYDGVQEPITKGKNAGQKPVFTVAKAKAKCDSIIKFAEDNKKPVPKRLPGHEKLSAALDDFDW